VHRHWPVMLRGVYQRLRIYETGEEVHVSSGGMTRLAFSPVDDGHRLPVGTVSVREDLIVDSDVLEALDDAKGCAREDGFDHTGRGGIIPDRNMRHGRRDRGHERFGFYKPNTR